MFQVPLSAARFNLGWVLFSCLWGIDWNNVHSPQAISNLLQMRYFWKYSLNSLTTLLRISSDTDKKPGLISERVFAFWPAIWNFDEEYLHCLFQKTDCSQNIMSCWYEMLWNSLCRFCLQGVWNDDVTEPFFHIVHVPGQLPCFLMWHDQRKRCTKPCMTPLSFLNFMGNKCQVTSHCVRMNETKDGSSAVAATAFQSLPYLYTLLVHCFQHVQHGLCASWAFSSSSSRLVESFFGTNSCITCMVCWSYNPHEVRRNLHNIPVRYPRCCVQRQGIANAFISLQLYLGTAENQGQRGQRANDGKIEHKHWHKYRHLCCVN